MWYETSWRRHLLDMHVEDWSDAFLDCFSVDQYVANLKKLHIQSAMIYLQNHVGHCFWKSESGHTHGAVLRKGEFIAELIDRCKDEGIAVVGYYSLIFNNVEHDRHPDWREVDENGHSQREQGGRYGHCCPNNTEYRAFVEAQVREIVAHYPRLDGIFFDMTFWSVYCHCPACKKRFYEETGYELPRTADHADLVFAAFRKKRQEWMGEFAAFATGLVKRLAPQMTVQHNNASALSRNDMIGTTLRVTDQCDFVCGDLYQDIYSHSVACKMYRNMTLHQPFEYMLSRTYSLKMHTLSKSSTELLAENMVVCANHGASFLIDAIDPDGQMDDRVYDAAAAGFEKLVSYEPYMRGTAVEDIGIYANLDSRYTEDGSPFTHCQANMTVSKNLTRTHIPHGFVFRKEQLKKHKAVLVCALAEIPEETETAMLEYVRNGGNLYVSDIACQRILKTCFDYETGEQTSSRMVYFSPTESGKTLFEPYTERYPLPMAWSVDQPKTFRADAVLATLTLPATHPKEKRFVSIHSDPPMVKTDVPVLALTSYGKGHILWSALPLEAERFPQYGIMTERFCDLLMGKENRTIYSDAPKTVDLTAFSDADDFLISATDLNAGDDAVTHMPFTISVKTERPVVFVERLPDGKPVAFMQTSKGISFLSEPLCVFDMYRIVYAK